MKHLLAFVLLPSIFHGALQAQGVPANWDVAQSVTALANQAGRLKPLLEQLTPDQWMSQGAPAAYVAQWHSAQNELGYMVNAAKAMEKQPERLTLALETYFRIQAMEAEVASLVEGVRRYQNPSVGDQLVSVIASNSSNRDQLRQYITDLAGTKEQEFKIVDAEAQRCRGDIVRQAPAKSPARIPARVPAPAPAK